MRMPLSIKVGPHVYQVLRKTAKELPDALGICNFNSLEIWIRCRLRGSKAKEILLHEILHATTHPSFNGEEKTDDESLVNAVAPVLLQVLQDNPELVAYLTE